MFDFGTEARYDAIVQQMGGPQQANNPAARGIGRCDPELPNRVYYELRNLGLAPQDRAMNYAATNAYQTREAFADCAARNMELDKSPICRPDSDCWDVQLSMFDPDNERRANRIYRYTVDVSEVLPVTVGAVRTWAARART